MPKVKTPATIEKVVHLEVKNLCAAPWNQDRKVDADFVRSVKSVGTLIHPIIVRANPSKTREEYQVVCGARRVAAYGKLQWAKVPAIIRELTDAAAQATTLIENKDRANLTSMQSADAIVALLAVPNADLRSVADQIGATPAWTRERQKLSAIIPGWRILIDDPKSPASGLPVRSLALIASLPAAMQEEVLEQALDSFDLFSEALDVTEFGIWIKDQLYAYSMNAVPWDTSSFTIADRPTCDDCHQQTSQESMLFKIHPDGDRGECLFHQCFESKMAAYVELQRSKSKVPAIKLDLSHAPTEVETSGYAISDTLPKYAFLDKCKKSTPGAIPVMRVWGKDAGKVEWRKRPYERPGKGGATPGKPTMTASQKRDAKRGKQFIEYLRLAVEGFDPELESTERWVEVHSGRSTEELLGVAIEFGISPCGEDWTEIDAFLTHPMKLYARLYTGVAESLMETLSVRHCEPMEKQVKFARQIAEFLLLDVEQFDVDCLLKVPEPTGQSPPKPEAKAKKKVVRKKKKKAKR